MNKFSFESVHDISNFQFVKVFLVWKEIVIVFDQFLTKLVGFFLVDFEILNTWIY